MFATDPDAAENVIHRTDNGTYEALRLIVGTRGDTSYAETTADMRAIAAIIDADTVDDGRSESGTIDGAAREGAVGVTAIATGNVIVNRVIERYLFDTLINGFVVTFLAVVVLLTTIYRLAGKGASLGMVTLLPVTLSMSWILGTMALLEIPFNVLTVTITSLGIGLGVDYSIHVSARYRLELDRRDDVWNAMYTTVTGTGGALFGSAMTTTAAFGTLGFALLPVIGQFGLIMAVTIAYAFLASVVVLPLLLVLWTRYWGPDVPLEAPNAGVRPATTGSRDQTEVGSDAGSDGPRGGE